MSDDDYLNEGMTFRHKDENPNFNYCMVLSKYFISLEADHKMSKDSLKSVAASNKHLMATVVAKCTRKFEKLLRDVNLTDYDVNDVVEDFNFKMCEEVLKSADVFLQWTSKTKCLHKIMPTCWSLFGYFRVQSCVFEREEMEEKADWILCSIKGSIRKAP